MVINLDSATTRWEFQQRQLQYLNIPFTRLSATSKDSMDSATYEQWANDWQRKLRYTEVACFLSHYRCWQVISQTNQPWLILEDDALLSIQLPNVLHNIENLLLQNPVAFDHISFETRGRKKIYSKQPWYTVDFAKGVICLHKLLLDKSGAAAYLLTPHGARILIQTVEKSGAGLADAMLCHNKELTSLQTLPALALQMDMANHYQLGIMKAQINNMSQSSISNTANDKPAANNLFDKLNFKYRRLLAQIEHAGKQFNFHLNSINQEISPNQADFQYLNFLK